MIKKFTIMPRKTFDIIKLALHGCTNRPFYHIVLLKNISPRDAPPVEQLGTYDPMPNIFNEKIVSLDVDRIKFHLANGVALSRPVEKLLGLSGMLPVHPVSYLTAMRNKRKLVSETTKQEKESTDVK
ncbi:28S ribosomal protein S16, mitochondrial-like isoform X1 [Biomphalaria glabrata]|uniref:Small ribosomal subunit protein bS16m n=1 Tax=Biomphalaria glabrata TaxID=6526 RepID=A0A9W2ZU44_BIOGL|nr:28S ribosomal protein S16, mitochondrial-like isoform X1 [Biomphalaria glabrata]